MLRLVKQHHEDLVQSTHLHLAGELQQEGNFRDAEKHFIAAQDWKAAVNMYRQLDMWEEAYRVTKLAFMGVPGNKTSIVGPTG